MPNIVLNKRIGKTPAGGTVNMAAGYARVLVALGHAYYEPTTLPKKPAPVPKSAQAEEAKTKRAYVRRDMVAEQAPAPVSPWDVTKVGDV
jgi:hypothetical protein